MLGILLALGALLSAVQSAIINLYGDFDTRLTLEGMDGVAPGSLILGCTKVVASIMICMAGIYLLRHRSDIAKVRIVPEKLRVAHTIYLVGLVAVIVSLVLDLRTITLVLSPTLANPYCLLALPLLRLAMDGVALRAEGTSSKRAALTPVVLVLICVITLYQMYMTGYSTFSVLFG